MATCISKFLYTYERSFCGIYVSIYNSHLNCFIVTCTLRPNGLLPNQ